MKKALVAILFCVCILLGCTKEKENIIDNSCAHEWIDVDWNVKFSGGIIYDIYCPKCESEQTITSKEWNKIQADLEYRDKNK